MGYISSCNEKHSTIEILTDNLITEKYVQSTKTLSVKEMYEVICFNRKKKISYHEILEGIQIHREASRIMNSYMVVIRTNSFFKTKVVKMLGEICAKCKHYSPIVYSEDNDIIFFPKLRYQDGYFIKSILENTMQHKQYQVVYGNEEMIMI